MSLKAKLKKLFKLCDHKWVFNARPFLTEGGMSKGVELRCTKCGKIVFKDLFSKFARKAKGTFIFCPSCNTEMLHKPECYIESIKDITTLKCCECNCETDWYMKPPVPIRVPRAYNTPEYIADHEEEFKGVNWEVEE